MPGLPAIYFHSLFGSTNDLIGLNESKQNRRINRQKFNFDDIEFILKDPNSRQSIILSQLKKLIQIRKKHVAFDPYGAFEIMSPENGVISIARIQPDSKQSIYGYFNLKNSSTTIDLKHSGWKEIITNKMVGHNLEMKPLTFVWLKKA